MPTLEDVLPNFRNTRVFTKLDVKEFCWLEHLSEQSSLLATMITPFGRLHWVRLPFGLTVSSEIFQKHLTKAFDSLNGVIFVADDIGMVGCGDTQTEAEKDHAEKLNASRTGVKKGTSG